MDESPDQIEDHIRSTRQELGNNLQQLENRLKDATNWRVQFERHPWALLGIAFAGGALLSAGVGGRRRRGSYARQRWASPPSTDIQGEKAESATSHIWDGIKKGLASAAGAHITALLSEIVPGYPTGERLAERSGPARRPARPAPVGNGGPDASSH